MIKISQEKILEYLQSHPNLYFCSTDLSVILAINRNSISVNITKLIKSGAVLHKVERITKYLSIKRESGEAYLKRQTNGVIYIKHKNQSTTRLTAAERVVMFD